MGNPLRTPFYEQHLALEYNNIICNYQAVPDEVRFTAWGAPCLGISEMTRFEMTKTDFQELASLARAVVLKTPRLSPRVEKYGSGFRIQILIF